MAQKVQVVLVDDVDGGEATETVSFTVDGVGYEVDLSAENAAKFRAAVEPWVSAGRRVSGRKSAARGRSGSDAGKIRAWAKAHGLNVSERGRIASHIVAQYEAAQ